MLRFLPAGWVGLMLGGLIAANSSTILTHLNWGASYLVHDFYRRFVYPAATEKHYVRAGRCATVLLFVGSSSMVFLLSTAKDSFNLLLQVGAGTGLLYLLRWFWWRITAWCEIVAMISSFGAAIVFLILSKNGMVFSFSEQLLIGIAITTVSWIAAAFLGPQTDEAVLLKFYEKVRPFGPGWRHIKAMASVAEVEGDNIPLALTGWTMGCTMIWSALFTVGNFLYGRTNYALVLGGIFAVSGLIVIQVVRRLWK
jgi:Na+/proline symporter